MDFSVSTVRNVVNCHRLSACQHTETIALQCRFRNESILKMLLEPHQSLQESILFCVLGNLVTQLGSHRESVCDATVQVDLVGETGLLEDNFRFVTLLGGENLVGLGGGDGEGSTDGLEFIGFDERGVSDVTDVEFVLFGVEMADDVFGAEAVADGGDFL